MFLDRFSRAQMSDRTSKFEYFLSTVGSGDDILGEPFVVGVERLIQFGICLGGFV